MTLPWSVVMRHQDTSRMLRRRKRRTHRIADSFNNKEESSIAAIRQATAEFGRGHLNSRRAPWLSTRAETSGARRERRSAAGQARQQSVNQKASIATPTESDAKQRRAIRLAPIFVICAAGCVLRFAVPMPAGLDHNSWSLLIVFLAALAGLITQPAPMGVLFLTTISVAVLAGVLTPAQALAGYSNNILWLIVIAFMFARAFVKTGLGRRIALVIITQIGTSSLRLGYSLSLTDLILAPVTAPNTARTGAIVFPIAVSLSREFGSNPGPTASRIGSFLLFTAYQANLVTSALFLTAMASNPLAAEFANQIAGVNISWSGWLAASSLPGTLFWQFPGHPNCFHRVEGTAKRAGTRCRVAEAGPSAGTRNTDVYSWDWRWYGEHSNCTVLTPLSPGWLGCVFCC
jgi:hypothetical protein